MIALTEMHISCPHCRRQYTMKIDPERLQRLKTRATCGRCGKTFDAASRIIAAQQPQPPQPQPQPQSSSSSSADTRPKLPRTDVKPPPSAQLQPTMRASGVTVPDLRDEMEELAREFAEAAARFTPVGIKRSAVGLGSEASPPPAAKPASVEEPTNPGVLPRSLAAPPSAPSDDAPPPTLLPADDAAPAAELSLDAEPAGDDEFAAAVPTLSRAPAAPRSWLDLADPGLASLESPPSPGAAALSALLDEPDVALPPGAS